MSESQVRALHLEREVKALIRGKLTPGSGSKGIKGDAQSEQFHVEAKYRSHWLETDALPLEVEWLETLLHQCKGRTPVLALEWESGRRLLLLPAIDWELLTEELPPTPFLERPGRKIPFGWPEAPVTHWFFPALQAPEQRWVGLHWDQFADLRRLAQPRKESTGFRRTDSGISRTALPSGGTRRRLGGGGFRRRPKKE